MGGGMAGKRSPELVAPGKMPPFVGMSGEALGIEHPVQQAAARARLLVGIGKLRALHLETVAVRESSGGKYVSVKLAFRAESREQYEVAHAVLRDHPEVKWTL